MPSIREARPDDLPQIAFMLDVFHEKSGLPTAVDAGTLGSTLLGLMEARFALMLVSERDRRLTGVSCVIAAPVWFNGGVLEATELFWWGERALLEPMESWARGVGASSMQIGAIDHMHRKGLDRAYGRLGYRPKERFYVKEL